MHITITDLLQCHLLTQNGEVQEAFPFAPRSLGFVTPMAYEVVFGDSKIIKMVPYSCTIGGTYDECAALAKTPLIGLNEPGVTYWEVVSPPQVVSDAQQKGWVETKPTAVRFTATYRLVWIVNRLLLGYDCCSIADLIMEDLMRRIYENRTKINADCIEGTQTTCSGIISSAHITKYNFLGVEAFMALFGKYEVSLFKLYTCAPFEFGAMDITVEFTKCYTDLATFTPLTPIPC